MFAFLLVWVGRARPVLGGILGVLIFELFNATYAVTSTLRGYPSNIVSVWTFVALATVASTTGAAYWILQIVLSGVSSR
jgi:hypothetical protein